MKNVDFHRKILQKIPRWKFLNQQHIHMSFVNVFKKKYHSIINENGKHTISVNGRRQFFLDSIGSTFKRKILILLLAFLILFKHLKFFRWKKSNIKKILHLFLLLNFFVFKSFHRTNIINWYEMHINIHTHYTSSWREWEKKIWICLE